MSDTIETKKRGGGPKTPAGRRRSSWNRLRHGLFSEALLLPNESQENFDHLREMYLESFQPVGFVELELVDELVAIKWRHRRNWSVETATISHEMQDQYEQIAKDYKMIDGATRIALAVGELGKNSARLDLIARCDTRFHRMYHRTLKHLMEIQDKRKRDGASPVNTELSDPLPPNDEKLRNELAPERYEPAEPEPAGVIDPVTLVRQPAAREKRRPVTIADWIRCEPLQIPKTLKSRIA